MGSICKWNDTRNKMMNWVLDGRLRCCSNAWLIGHCASKRLLAIIPRSNEHCSLRENPWSFLKMDLDWGLSSEYLKAIYLGKQPERVRVRAGGRGSQCLIHYLSILPNYFAHSIWWYFADQIIGLPNWDTAYADDFHSINTEHNMSSHASIIRNWGG